jgi:hypothetical protein
MKELVLSREENLTLKECEFKIQKGIEAFEEMGKALALIQDRKLYREKYSRFEDYLLERWGLQKRAAYRLIDSFQTNKLLREKNFEVLPEKESVARELAGLDDETKVKVWERVSDGVKVTAKAVRTVRDEITGAAEDLAPVTAYVFRNSREKGRFNFLCDCGIDEEKAFIVITRERKPKRKKRTGNLGRHFYIRNEIIASLCDLPKVTGKPLGETINLILSKSARAADVNKLLIGQLAG